MPAGRPQGGPVRAVRRRAPCRGSCSTARRSSARARSCARWTSGCPSRRCCRPTRRSASRSGSPSSGATRSCSRSCGARSGWRCGARRRRCRPTARARGSRSPTPSRASPRRSSRAPSSASTTATELNVRADLAALDHHLARVERWMDHDVVGGEQPNAADLQIGSGLALLLTIEDIDRRVRRAAGVRARRGGGSRTTRGTCRRARCRRSGSAGEQRLGRGARMPTRRRAALEPPNGGRSQRSHPPFSRRSSDLQRRPRAAHLGVVRHGIRGRSRRQRDVRVDLRAAARARTAARSPARAAASAAPTRTPRRPAAARRRRSAAARGARRPPRGRATARPPCTRRAAPPGSSSVSIRITALRNSGWSSTSPTGSVS